MMGYSEEAPQIDDDGNSQEPFDPTEIRILREQVSFFYLIERLNDGRLDLYSDFQRDMDLWNDVAQSRFIESLLIHIPIPAFYFDATDEEKWLVIDGVQRLTALARFVMDEQMLSELHLSLPKLMLNDLEFLTHLNGQKFEELTRSHQRRIEETLITLYKIEWGTSSPVRSVRDVIRKRVNTSGLHRS